MERTEVGMTSLWRFLIKVHTGDICHLLLLILCAI